MIALIQAGGAGTRLAEITGGILPKPMVKINGKPILQYQVENLVSNEVTDITIVISSGGESIREFFGDGTAFGAKISYIEETTPLGTAGALAYFDKGEKEDFILLFGDLMVNVDWKRFAKYHKEKGGLLTAFAHPNSHPYDSDVLLLDEERRITGIAGKKDPRDFYYKNVTNAGLYIVSPEVKKFVAKSEKADFEKVVLRHFVEEGRAYAYLSSEYVKDCGTPERYYGVSNDEKSGVVYARNLANPQRAIFLDRDGTINVFGDFVRTVEAMTLRPDAAPGIRKINTSPFLAICITNQPVVARGETSFETLAEIHRKMETLLGKEGAYLDDLYFCPHHPDKGFAGEVPELKIDCDCRKPKIGMLKKAAEEHNIDLHKSWFIGDTNRDVQTGINGGCRTILITTGDPHFDHGFPDTHADYECKTLDEAVDLILKLEDKGEE